MMAENDDAILRGLRAMDERDQLREICAGLMGWNMTAPGFCVDDYGERVPGYEPDRDPTQALELLIHVAGNQYVIDGRVVQLLNESEAPMIEHDNTPSGIALAICRAVCRANGIEVGEVG
jgi:hypothetical protein